jgi:hypothetical protein
MNRNASIAAERDFAVDLAPAGVGETRDLSEKLNLIVGSFRKLDYRDAASGEAAAR